MPNRAVIVGINDYPGMTPLDGPCADALAFRDWVTDPSLGAVDPANVDLVLSTDFPPPAQPSAARPFDADLVNRLNALTPNGPGEHVGDRLYLFVAGHGMSDADKPDSAALIAANAIQNAPQLPSVIMTDYANYFHKTYAFKEIILLMDCCLDATVLRPLNPTNLLRGPVHSRAHEVKTFIGQATLWNKKSYEKPFNGGVRGIFSLALMNALYAAPSPTTAVTGKAIARFVADKIHEFAAETAVEPPRFFGHNHEQIVFYQRNDPDAGRVTITIHAPGTANGALVELFDGSLNPLPGQPVQNEKATFKVAPGIYKVRLQGTERKLVDEVLADYEATI